MKNNRSKKPAIFFIAAAAFACTLFFISETNSEKKIDLSLIDQFYQLSSLGPFREDEIIYFDWGPKDDSRGFRFFNLALKTENVNAAKIAENPIFSKSIPFNSPPTFSSRIKSIPKADSYTIAGGKSPGNTDATRNIKLTIGNYSNFSYVYIDMIVENK